jgi:hypothetical protein
MRPPLVRSGAVWIDRWRPRAPTWPVASSDMTKTVVRPFERGFCVGQWSTFAVFLGRAAAALTGLRDPAIAHVRYPG